jgi:rSAM/selenodomain-associated transferase 1
VLPAQVIVLAKEPVAGRVKTRLCPPYEPEQAAALAGAALRDTIDAVRATPVRRRVLALDGPGDRWSRAGFPVLAQRGDGLDERIAHALTDAWAGAALPMLLVGMDTPQLTSEHVLSALARLLGGWDAAFGPAADGGFWALGLRRPFPGLVRGVPMSSPRTGEHLLGRLRAAGLRTALLPRLRDIDTASDAAAVAPGAPGSCFARTLAAIGPAVQDVVGSAT